MKRLSVLVILVAVTSLLFFLSAADGAELLGMPLTCGNNIESGPTCWIGIGSRSVIALGGGLGVVELGIAGFGLLFATGQIAVGAIALGQLALATTGFLGQVGCGLVGMGQGGLGLKTVTQGGDNAEGKRFLKAMSAELDQVLRFTPGREPKLPG